MSKKIKGMLVVRHRCSSTHNIPLKKVEDNIQDSLDTQHKSKRIEDSYPKKVLWSLNQNVIKDVIDCNLAPISV